MLYFKKTSVENMTEKEKFEQKKTLKKVVKNISIIVILGLIAYYAYPYIMKWVKQQSNVDSITTKQTTNTKNLAHYISNDFSGVISDEINFLTWQNTKLVKASPEDAGKICQKLTLNYSDDWRLPTRSESELFHKETSKQKVKNIAASYIEIIQDGYIQTARGANKSGGKPGDNVLDVGKHFIRCVRDDINYNAL
jgi:hypothetical protein